MSLIAGVKKGSLFGSIFRLTQCQLRPRIEVMENVISRNAPLNGVAYESTLSYPSPGGDSPFVLDLSCGGNLLDRKARSIKIGERERGKKGKHSN